MFEDLETIMPQAITKQDAGYVYEDLQFPEFYSTKPVIKNNQLLCDSSSILDLEKQLSKFNQDQKVEEARTHSFLAKVNAHITSNFSPTNSSAYKEHSNSFVTADSDNRFILQKNSNYYFPDINEG